MKINLSKKVMESVSESIDKVLPTRGNTPHKVVVKFYRSNPQVPSGGYERTRTYTVKTQRELEQAIDKTSNPVYGGMSYRGIVSVDKVLETTKSQVTESVSGPRNITTLRDLFRMTQYSVRGLIISGYSDEPIDSRDIHELPTGFLDQEVRSIHIQDSYYLVVYVEN